MTQEARSVAQSRKKSTPAPVKPDSHSTTGAAPSFLHYQAAVQLLQEGKWERALAAFEKMLPTAPIEIRERCKMYISTCKRQLERPALTSPPPRNTTTTLSPS